MSRNIVQCWIKLGAACSSQKAFVSVQSPLKMLRAPFLWKEPSSVTSLKMHVLLGQHGSVVELQSMNQEVMVRFLVRAHAHVAGPVPSRGRAGGI